MTDAPSGCTTPADIKFSVRAGTEQHQEVGLVVDREDCGEAFRAGRPSRRLPFTETALLPCRHGVPGAVDLSPAAAAPTDRLATAVRTGHHELALLAGFAVVLNKSRTTRGSSLSTPRLTSRPSGPETPHLPHVLVAGDGRPALVFELVSSWEEAATDLRCSPSAVRRWAARHDGLLALVAAAPRPAAPAPGPHLSFRWVARNEETAARALVLARGTALDHVSVHVPVDALPAVLRFFTLGLGLPELPRPAAVTVPGHWLHAGTVLLHLNARRFDRGTQAAQVLAGSAPNHVAVRVGDLEGTVTRLVSQGHPVSWGGSLGDRTQAWFRPGGGLVLELQQARAA